MKHLLTILILAATLLAARDWTHDLTFATQNKNTVQATFTDGTRSAFLITSPLMKITANLRTDSDGCISIQTPDGIPLVNGSFDAYIITQDNETYHSSQSVADGRMNTFRIGYYYYDTHILDQQFCQAPRNDEKLPTETLNINGFEDGIWSINMVSQPVFKNKVMSFTCADTYDPWIGRLGIDAPARTYNALEFTMKTTTSSMLILYMAAGPHANFNATQHLPVPLVPDGKFHTYKVYLDTMADFYGDIHGIRFDVGNVVGETVEIKDIRLLAERHHSVPAKLERILHTFPDKTHQTIRIALGSVPPPLKEYGCTLVLPKKDIAQVIVKDRKGLHQHLNNLDVNSVEYVGFDFAKGGVFGLIFPSCAESGLISITENATSYTVQQYRFTEGELSANSQLLVNHRLYRDKSHSFDKLAQMAYIERNPLSANIACEHFVGYNRLDGVYEFKVGGTGFNEAYFKIPQRHFTCTPKITGDAADRIIYCRGLSTGGLECAALLDEQQLLLPMPMEVSKNFRGEKEEPYYYPQDLAYGETLFPITIKANETCQFTLVDLFQMWGQFPLKQLSSIQFFITYYHLSCGVTETNCIAPYYVNKKDGWTLPDFRAMSATFWKNQPQHYSLGPMRYPFYFNEKNEKIMFEPKTQTIASAGPVYADISFDYLSEDEAVSLRTRHVEFPQTDENRTYYSFSWLFNKPVHFTHFQKNVNLYMLDTNWAPFKHLGYLNTRNEPAIADLQAQADSMIPLGSHAPYFTIYTSGGKKSLCNFGLIVKDIRVIRNGKAQPATSLLALEKPSISTTRARLTLDYTDITFQPGDRIDYDILLVPFGDADVDNDTSVRKVRQDSVIKPYALSVASGTIISDTYLPHLAASSQRAEFTLSAGAGNAVVRVDGFASYKRPLIEIKQPDGNYLTYKTNYHDYDGYQAFMNKDGSYGFAFVLDMSKQPTYTVRVSQGE